MAGAVEPRLGRGEDRRAGAGQLHVCGGPSLRRESAAGLPDGGSHVAQVVHWTAIAA